MSWSVAPGWHLASSGHLEHPGPFVGALCVLQGELAGAWGWGPPCLATEPQFSSAVESATSFSD